MISQKPVCVPLQVTLLGPFSIRSGSQTVHSWPRPPVKRLCELVFVSPSRRVLRDVAGEELFPNLNPRKANVALTKAVSLARAALSELGGGAQRMLGSDRNYVWADPGLVEETDFESHTRALLGAIGTQPGNERDDLLSLALKTTGTLLEDEPFAAWAVRPRERLDWLRQEGRLMLARARAQANGRFQVRSVIEAWEDCLAHDPTCEEAACALMRIYTVEGRQSLVERIYKGCRKALEDLGLDISPSLEEARKVASKFSSFSSCGTRTTTQDSGVVRRVVTVLFVELAGRPSSGGRMAAEELGYLVRERLTTVMAEVEVFGGTVAAVWGTGMVALFGAAEAHEDDPERGLRASFRAVAGANSQVCGVSVRAGVETGTSVAATIDTGSRKHYWAVGEAVATAAALQSIARPGSVLVGPATRAAVEDLFDWGPSQEVVVATSARPLRASYLQRPNIRPSHALVGSYLGNNGTSIGRGPQLSTVREAMAAVTAGQGGVVAIVGAAGVGKTRLVSECRELFTAWVRSGPGRLPLWLEGSGASYASTTPYGLYQRLISGWVGVGPEDGRAVMRTALERAIKAASAGTAEPGDIDLLADMMEIKPGKPTFGSRCSLEQHQRATFGALGSVVSWIVDHGPTVLVLEDLHWADPTSLHLTNQLLALTKKRPLLMVLTRRPGGDHGATLLETALLADPELDVRELELSQRRLF